LYESGVNVTGKGPPAGNDKLRAFRQEKGDREPRSGRQAKWGWPFPKGTKKGRGKRKPFPIGKTGPARVPPRKAGEGERTLPKKKSTGLCCGLQKSGEGGGCLEWVKPVFVGKKGVNPPGKGEGEAVFRGGSQGQALQAGGIPP